MKAILLIIAAATVIARAADAKSFWIEDPAAKTAVTSLIQKAGFNCPAAKLIQGLDDDVYGHVTKVWCGAAGDSLINDKLVFRVTIRPQGGAIIKPWTE